jgi:hypothetical protein
MSGRYLLRGFAPIIALAILAIVTSSLVTTVVVVQQKQFFQEKAALEIGGGGEVSEEEEAPPNPFESDDQSTADWLSENMWSDTGENGSNQGGEEETGVGGGEPAGCTEGDTEPNDSGGENYCSGGQWYSRPKSGGENTCSGARPPCQSGYNLTCVSGNWQCIEVQTEDRTTSVCAEGDRECNDSGGVNVCSGGSWHSEDARPGECGTTPITGGPTCSGARPTCQTGHNLTCIDGHWECLQSGIQDQPAGCTEGATEINDSGLINYCSGGKWYSRVCTPSECWPSEPCKAGWCGACENYGGTCQGWTPHCSCSFPPTSPTLKVTPTPTPVIKATTQVPEVVLQPTPYPTPQTFTPQFLKPTKYELANPALFPSGYLPFTTQRTTFEEYIQRYQYYNAARAWCNENPTGGRDCADAIVTLPVPELLAATGTTNQRIQLKDINLWWRTNLVNRDIEVSSENEEAISQLQRHYGTTQLVPGMGITYIQSGKIVVVPAPPGQDPQLDVFEFITTIHELTHRNRALSGKNAYTTPAEQAIEEANAMSSELKFAETLGVNLNQFAPTFIENRSQQIDMMLNQATNRVREYGDIPKNYDLLLKLKARYPDLAH